MFNPRPRIERVSLAPGRDAWVVDDILLDPEALRRRTNMQVQVAIRP